MKRQFVEFSMPMRLLAMQLPIVMCFVSTQFGFGQHLLRTWQVWPMYPSNFALRCEATGLASFWTWPAADLTQMRSLYDSSQKHH
jgi:hypothetical protein